MSHVLDEFYDPKPLDREDRLQMQSAARARAGAARAAAARVAGGGARGPAPRAGAGAGAHRVYRRGRCPRLASSHFEQLVAGNVLRLSTIMPQSDGVDWLFAQPPYV